MWQVISTTMRFLAEPASHFGLAFVLGSSASLLTSTICFALYKWASPPYRSKAGMVARFGMVILVLLVGLSAGLLSHGWLDSYSTWASTPLNPPLVILK